MAIDPMTGEDDGLNYQAPPPDPYAQPVGPAPVAAAPTAQPTAPPADYMDPVVAFSRGWLASGGKTTGDLKAFVASHPQYGATISGSAGGNVKIGGKEFDAVIGSHMGGTGAQWIDTANSNPSGGGPVDLTGQGINPTYLAPWTQQFTAPEGAAIQPFKAPTMNDDPSFDWRLGQLRGAMENSAAGKGLLNSGGSIYNTESNLANFINQDYGNVFNRAFTAWGGNRQNANDIYGRAWQNFIEQKDSFYKNQSNPFDKIARIASIGAGAAAQ